MISEGTTNNKSKNNNSDVKPNSTTSTFIEKTCCLNCGEKISTVISKNDQLNYAPHYHFFCNKCPFQWVRCSLCQSNQQPTLISIFQQSRSKKTLGYILQEQMMQHTIKFHPNLVQKSSIPNEIIENSCIMTDDNNSNSFTN